MIDPFWAHTEYGHIPPQLPLPLRRLPLLMINVPEQLYRSPAPQPLGGAEARGAWEGASSKLLFTICPIKQLCLPIAVRAARQACGNKNCKREQWLVTRPRWRLPNRPLRLLRLYDRSSPGAYRIRSHPATTTTATTTTSTDHKRPGAAIAISRAATVWGR